MVKGSASPPVWLVPPTTLTQVATITDFTHYVGCVLSCHVTDIRRHTTMGDGERVAATLLQIWLLGKIHLAFLCLRRWLLGKIHIYNSLVPEKIIMVVIGRRC